MSELRCFILPGSAYLRLEAVPMIAIFGEDGESYEPLVDLTAQVPEEASYQLFAELVGVMPGGERDRIAERATMAGIEKLVERLGGRSSKTPEVRGKRH